MEHSTCESMRGSHKMQCWVEEAGHKITYFIIPFLLCSRAGKLILDDKKTRMNVVTLGDSDQIVGSEWWLDCAVHLRIVYFMYVTFQ